MYKIDRKFLRPDGSIRVEAAMEAGRKERADTFGDGCRAMSVVLRRVWGALKARAGRKSTAGSRGLPESGTA